MVNENCWVYPYSVHLDENTIKTTSYLVIKIDVRPWKVEDVINWKEQLNGLLKYITNISWTNINREENTFPGGSFKKVALRWTTK